MGKKSRIKRERRIKTQKGQKKSLLADKSKFVNDKESTDFQRMQLEKLYSRYNAKDVCLALGVSDLWLPNISSQIKHYFAFIVFSSMTPQGFVGDTRIDNYQEFRAFIEAVYSIIPAFPMLEDYVPEMDWGEVKVELQGNTFRIFYGNTVERIPDFINSFKLSYIKSKVALEDMQVALTLQNHIITQVDRPSIGSTDRICSGYVEVPPEQFWQQCKDALMSASDVLLKEPSSGLIIQQGSFSCPSTWSHFSNSIMSGNALPAVLIEVGNNRFPLSGRNMPGVVIDYWASQANYASSAQDVGMTAPIAGFLQQRLNSRSVFIGPFTLLVRGSILTHRFAAVILGERKLYFVVVLGERALSLLPAIERDIRNIFATGQEWGVAPEDGRDAVQLLRYNEHPLETVEFGLIAVLPSIGTAHTSVKLPKTEARVLYLPDFVTIFDSIEDDSEFDRFWAYVDSNKSMISMMFLGITDLFGAFRDSHGLLLDGAKKPDFIALDPHWGSNWRYRELAKFWENAPPIFPDNATSWKVETGGEGVQRIMAKGAPALSWWTTVRGCVLHFVFRITEQNLDLLNGQLLELVVHCLADSISQRKHAFEKLAIFDNRRIVTVFYANEATLVTESENYEQKFTSPLLLDWKLTPDSESKSVLVKVFVNLAYAQTRLNNPKDARFEAESAAEWINGLQNLLGLVSNSNTLIKIEETASGKPRFFLSFYRKTIDIPDFANPDVPKPLQYKAARRDLAIIFMETGASPCRYELADAKVVIDSARDAYRQQIHAKIASFDRTSLLIFCIKQHDALLVKYRADVFRVQQSLDHEVSYDRSQAIADAYKDFVKEAKNYRYLLECCLSGSSSGSLSVTVDEVVGLVASIDWLFVLYGAGDVLHNDLEVAGVELDQNFIPAVFYSINREEQEKQFGIEMANIRLGLNLNPEDEVTSTVEIGDNWLELDQAFIKDSGFSLTHLSQLLKVLSCWQSIRGEKEFGLCYRAKQGDIVKVLLDSIDGISSNEAIRIIEFATLNPEQIRRLLGSPRIEPEADVPVWDHTKRGSRYLIRPLIPLEDGTLAWGAATVNRSFEIWTSSIADGYLPADFPWPKVNAAVRNIKKGLEELLEVRAYEVCSRVAPYVIGGIDFKFRFPKEKFDDVGDFDVLGYWPESNLWLVVECKYNQPPYCLKDARRLRERIFGNGSKRGHFSKIERRRDFLTTNADKIRSLLRWPEPKVGVGNSLLEIYVSRDTYWWMRNPPYDVPTHFVRIDGLDSWLLSNGFA